MYFILGYEYNATSVQQLNDFISRCRQHLQSDSNLFWVALQSNQLADLSDVHFSFKQELKKMKSELTKEGWVLPQLKANMRNQINISRISVVGAGAHSMQSSIEKLQSATNVLGEVPSLIKVSDPSDWDKKKDAILEHCLKEMIEKDNKNLVVLFDNKKMFKDIEYDLKKQTKNKTVVKYPSKQGNQKGLQNIKSFVEKDNHILVTKDKYFTGCEASQVLFLTGYSECLRNSLMRSVKNLICVQVGDYPKINGMKEFKRFY